MGWSVRRRRHKGRKASYLGDDEVEDAEKRRSVAEPPNDELLSGSTITSRCSDFNNTTMFNINTSSSRCFHSLYLPLKMEVSSTAIYELTLLGREWSINTTRTDQRSFLISLQDISSFSLGPQYGGRLTLDTIFPRPFTVCKHMLIFTKTDHVKPWLPSYRISLTKKRQRYHLILFYLSTFDLP